MTFICYIELYFIFSFLGCGRYIEDFVKSRLVISRFCSIYFVVILTGLKESFVISRALLYRGSLNQGSTVFFEKTIRGELKAENVFPESQV